MQQANTGRTVMVQGRIVWSSGPSLFQGKQKVDQNTKQPRVNAQGQPMIEYGFGLAVPKQSCQDIWNALHEEAFTLFPQRQLPPGFAMKFKDGDGIDHNGVSFQQREGYAQHIVLTCTTTLPIKWFKHEATGNIQVNEGIKCGDYVNVQLTIKAHGANGQAKPGLYLNPMAVQFLGYGKEIINTPSGDQIFGTQAPPQMGSPTPIAPAGMIMPMPGGPAAPPVQQQVAQQQITPNFNVIPPAHQPPAGGVVQPPPMWQQPPQQAMPPAQQQFQQPAGMPPLPR